MPRYIRIEKFAAETGYTAKAIRRKIEAGVFVEGVHYCACLPTSGVMGG